MPKPDAIADHLCEIVAGLTAHRQGRGPHWVMVETVAREMRRHGLDLAHDDLQAAIALCVERHVLKTAGTPPHSIAPWQREWDV
jgi:hypothetical protein